jgi:Na+-driven multidrug efflux pump
VLRRFAALLAGVLSLALFVMAATPLGRLWFSTVSGLSPELANLATSSLWFALLQPAVSVLQSWYQGALLNARATRGISEAVAIFLLVCALVLGFGTMRQAYPGIFVGWVAFTIAMIAQAGWLHFRGHRLIARLEQREKHAAVELVRANE